MAISLREQIDSGIRIKTINTRLLYPASEPQSRACIFFLSKLPGINVYMTVSMNMFLKHDALNDIVFKTPRKAIW